jgi:hypothetical protein
MKRIMFGSEWDTVTYYITKYWNLFIDWFQGLDIPAQVLVGIFLLFGAIAIIYIIYGAFWITGQSIKFSILITGISLYMSVVIIALPIVAITGPKNIPGYWRKAGDNVKWFVARMYPIKGKHKQTVESVTYTTQSAPAQNPPVVIIKEVAKPKPEPIVEEIKQTVDPNPPAPSKARESFCPDCGEPFSDRMKYVLLEKTFTFCESCGTKIYRRD